MTATIAWKTNILLLQNGYCHSPPDNRPVLLVRKLMLMTTFPIFRTILRYSVNPFVKCSSCHIVFFLVYRKSKKVQELEQVVSPSLT